MNFDLDLKKKRKRPAAPAEQVLMMYPEFVMGYRQLGWFYQDPVFSPQGMLVGAFNRKCNDGARLSARGLRVRFEGAAPTQSALYFRGPVLTDFDGVEWRPLRSGFPAHMELQANLQVNGDEYLTVAREVQHQPEYARRRRAPAASTASPASHSAQVPGSGTGWV